MHLITIATLLCVAAPTVSGKCYRITQLKYGQLTDMLIKALKDALGLQFASKDLYVDYTFLDTGVNELRNGMAIHRYSGNGTVYVLQTLTIRGPTYKEWDVKDYIDNLLSCKNMSD